MLCLVSAAFNGTRLRGWAPRELDAWCEVVWYGILDKLNLNGALGIAYDLNFKDPFKYRNGTIDYLERYIW